MPIAFAWDNALRGVNLTFLLDILQSPDCEFMQSHSSSWTSEEIQKKMKSYNRHLRSGQLGVSESEYDAARKEGDLLEDFADVPFRNGTRNYTKTVFRVFEREMLATLRN